MKNRKPLINACLKGYGKEFQIMIKSKEDYFFYLKADRIANSRSKKQGFVNWLNNKTFPDEIQNFQKTLRKLEYSINCEKGFLAKLDRFFIRLRFIKLSYKLGFSIPVNVCGPGLSIAHFGNIIINKGTQIGANCRIHSGVNIGTEAGYSKLAPIIGDNCYIGPGAKLFGPIKIASGCAVGANAVVTKSCIEENKALIGIPAKPVKDINTKKLLIPATELMKLKVPEDSLLGKTANEIFKKVFEK